MKLLFTRPTLQLPQLLSIVIYNDVYTFYVHMPVLTAIKIKPLVTSSTLKFGILLACFLCFGYIYIVH